MHTVQEERKKIKKLLIGGDSEKGYLDTEIESIQHQLKDQSIGREFRIDLEAKLNQTVKIKAKIQEWL